MTESSIAPSTAASVGSPSARPELPRYITIREAAEALDTKPWPIMQLVRNGELGAIQYGEAWLIAVEDVERLDGVVPQGRAVFPATPEVLRALDLPLQAINRARGTSHTLKSVAADACGLDIIHPDELTLADTDAMAAYIGGTLLLEANQ